jgi:hypothetical protein
MRQFQGLAPPKVIPGRRAAASPKSIFQRPVFMIPGLAFRAIPE